MTPIPDAMQLKHALGQAKVTKAVAENDGTTVFAAHLLPHLAYLLPSILDAGVRMVELSAGSIYLERNPPSTPVYEGGRYDARQFAHTVDVEEVAARVAQLRKPLGEHVFINIAIPSVMNAVGTSPLTADEARTLSRAGADGLHAHLSSLAELESLTSLAHAHGLLVEAYIHRFESPEDPFSYMGIAADTPNEVAKAAEEMRSIGVDIIGLMFSADPKYYSQSGASESLSEDVEARFVALRQAVPTPISAEGQITPGNARRLRDIGVDILVLGSQFDIAFDEAIKSVVASHSGRR